MKNSWGASCSGTAVSDTTLITAAHCFAGANSRMIVGKAFSEASLASAEVDVGVAVFPKGTFQEFSRVLDRSPTARDAIALVGFGERDFINSSGDFGTKRMGTNELVGFATQHGSTLTHSNETGNFLHYRSPISISGLKPGEWAMTGRGDSGGPIFIEGKLAGVVSWGDTRRGIVRDFTLVDEPTPDNEAIYEYDTNLLSETAQAFLRKAQDALGGTAFLP